MNKFLKNGLVLLSVIAFTLKAHSIEEPTITNKELKYSKEIEKKMKGKNFHYRALKEKDFAQGVIDLFNNPKAYAEGELPYAAVADFNLDSKKDLAFLGTDGNYLILQIAISQGESYKVYPVWKGDYNQEVLIEEGKSQGLIKYLSLIPKDKNKASFKKLGVKPRACLQLEMYRGAVQVFCFIKGKVKEY